MVDLYKRFKNIKTLRKSGIPPHQSESAWRHWKNVIFQKDLHTLTDIENKVKAGKFTLDQAIKESDRIMPNMSSTQRIDLMNEFRTHLPVQPTSTTTAATGYYPGYTSTTSGTKPLTGPLNPNDISNLSGAEKLARSRKNIK
jgi:hypothetical protein